MSKCTRATTRERNWKLLPHSQESITARREHVENFSEPFDVDLPRRVSPRWQLDPLSLRCNLQHFCSALCFWLSLNSNRDSGVISYTMLFLRRRGLTVLLPATSVGGPLAPGFQRKCPQRGAWAFPFELDLQWSSSCSSGQSAAQRRCAYGRVRSHLRSTRGPQTLLG